LSASPNRGYAVVDWFNDPAVSGADPIESRPGFAALLNRIEGNGVRVVLIEDASRFARDLMAQELGLGVLMRQIAGTFAQLEKARLVAKLKAARDASARRTASAKVGRVTLRQCRRPSPWRSSCTPMACRIAKSPLCWQRVGI
jgi:DNA invertase Pin-like site-specific DNA recombinase